jgi:hypothetical protein
VKPAVGIKARVAKVLELAQAPLTMGEIMDKADIPKTSASEVSSALFKLRGQAKVKTVGGESTSKSGPRYVKRYVWVRVAHKAPVAQPRVESAISPFQMLGIGRLG